MRDFAVKFLECQGPIYGKDWPDDLFSEFVEKFRSAIGPPQKIVWVNPVALLRYSPADELIGPAHGGGPWADIKTASIFQPIAIEPTAQGQLDAAFTQIIRDHEGQHLSQALDTMSFVTASFYECARSGSAEIDIRCSESKGVVQTISNINYEQLFGLSPRILFLPTPVFSLRAAQSPIHTNCLLGSYVGVLDDFECVSDAGAGDYRACPLGNRSLRDALDWAERLFFARRRLDHAKELKKLLDQTREHGDLQKMQRIRPALDRVANSFAEVTKLRDDLEEIKSVIDPEHMSPGSAKYADLAAMLYKRVFGGTKHEVGEHEDSSVLIKAIGASEFAREVFLLQSQLVQRLSKEKIESMFSVWNAGMVDRKVNNLGLPSVALAKWISKKHYVPLAWMKAAAGARSTDDEWFAAGKCEGDPIGVCSAIASLVRDGFSAQFDVEEEKIVLCLKKADQTSVASAGLSELRDYANCDTGGGESSRSLRYLRHSVASNNWQCEAAAELIATISFPKNSTK